MHSLNTLTTKLTAFPSWFAFAEAMDRGFIPTLMCVPGKSKANVARNALVTELRTRLVQMGYKVFAI